MTRVQPGKRLAAKRNGAVLAEHGLLLGMIAAVILTTILLFREAIIGMFHSAAVTLSQVMNTPGNRGGNQGGGNQGGGQGNNGNPGNSGGQGNNGNPGNSGGQGNNGGQGGGNPR